MFCRALRRSLNQHGAAATKTHLPFGNAPKVSHRSTSRIFSIPASRLFEMFRSR